MEIKTSLILIFLILQQGNCTSESNITAGDSFNGQSLITLGRQMNKPLLTLIGMAMQNLHQCEEWTTWTPCEAKTMGHFGIKKRTRTCITEETSGKRTQTLEDDRSICEGTGEKTLKQICPSAYNYTSHNFCIKLYLTAKNSYDAERTCHLDNGYLINIDSDEKYADVKFILTNGPKDTWVGGRRKGSLSEWDYLYGQSNGFYKSHWYSSSYPDSKPCLALENYLWFTYDCLTEWPFLCEIIF